MFYFENCCGRQILKSTFFNKGFFTTREGFDYTKLSPRRIISPVQTHSANIETVDERSEYPETDALILKNNSDLIYLKFADCTPIIFYDAKQNIGAVTHSGWRGTVQKIAPKTVISMNSNPNDIIALIGPAISLCCYEVSEEVKNRLLSTVSNDIGLYNGNNVDLKKINARQLEEIGVKQIDICPYCTSCDNSLFYSYRKENGTLQRHNAALMLK